jgi:hypothetical protein
MLRYSNEIFVRIKAGERSSLIFQSRLGFPIFCAEARVFQNLGSEFSQTQGYEVSRWRQWATQPGNPEATLAMCDVSFREA